MKNLKIFALGAITTICFSLTGCDFNSNKEEKPIILNVYNCAEYIDETVLDDFETYCLETFNEKVVVVPAEAVTSQNAKDFYFPDSAY